MSTLKLTRSQWDSIRKELHKEHPNSVFMLRERTKRVLGFTVREHIGYRLRTPKELDDYRKQDNDPADTLFFRTHIHENVICLDFYSEKKYTMFLLKFSEIINDRRRLETHF